MRSMKNGVKMKKKDWVKEVGEKKMAVFHTVMIVHVTQVGFVCLFAP